MLCLPTEWGMGKPIGRSGRHGEANIKLGGLRIKIIPAGFQSQAESPIMTKYEKSLRMRVLSGSKERPGIQIKVMNNNIETKHTWLTGLLTGWGIKKSWAKVLAGAIIGALCAAGLLCSCSFHYKQNALGDKELSATVVQPVAEESVK